MPGVLTCRHREKGLLEGGLDPRISAYIIDAGLDGLLWVPHMDLDYTLITALVERWRSKTHSFHLPHGEMTITLQDINVIMGVLVDGLSVVGYTSPRTNWCELCDDWLVERWRSETHSFHWPHGEMTITLQDMEVIMGVPVDGLPVVGYTSPRTN